MLFKLEGCGGCRTCEIACSFKLTGEFNHQAAGIEIVEQENGVGFDVRLLDHPEGTRLACDGCKDLKEPFCLSYCHQRIELQRIIEEFKKKCN